MSYSRQVAKFSAALLPAALCLLAACATHREKARGVVPTGFSYLSASGSSIRTTHRIPLAITAPASFRATPVKHRRADFGGNPYEISLAALLGANEAVMVHAERVANDSGASNYEELPAAPWPDPSFRIRSFCAEVSAAMVAEEHDLGWLRSSGWDPTGSVAMDQYLTTTPDHNQEVVMSLIVRGVDCADRDAVQRALSELRSKVRVRRP